MTDQTIADRRRLLRLGHPYTITLFERSVLLSTDGANRRRYYVTQYQLLSHYLDQGWVYPADKRRAQETLEHLKALQNPSAWFCI